MKSIAVKSGSKWYNERLDRLRTLIVPAALKAEQETGCPAELSVAQCIIESFWLERMPGNNCFGIKDTDRYPGNQYLLTREYIKGTWQKQLLAFEIYPTLADCFADHARLLTGKKPYAKAWTQYREDKDLGALILGVASVYATDPGYAATLFRLLAMSMVQMALKEGREAAALTATMVDTAPTA